MFPLQIRSATRAGHLTKISVPPFLFKPSSGTSAKLQSLGPLGGFKKIQQRFVTEDLAECRDSVGRNAPRHLVAGGPSVQSVGMDLTAEPLAQLFAYLDPRPAREADGPRQGSRAGYASVNLGAVISKKLAEERKTQLFKEKIEELGAEIAANQESSQEQASQRAEAQQRLADLAAKRIEKDALIDAVLRDLRALLARRSEITAEMQSLGDEIDLHADWDAKAYS